MGNRLEGSRDKETHQSSCYYSSQRESRLEDRLKRLWEIGQNLGGEHMSRRKVFKSISILGACTPEQ